MTTTFADLGLSEDILRAVSKMGYENPTPVQEQAIPAALEGRDIIAGAQTGTGKTAAFCLPSMDGLDHCKKGCGPYMLVVTPTRELADQICEVCDQIAKVTKHKVAKFVGGVSYNPQKQALKRGIDVLIATPGRLEDLINQGAAKLDQVKILVLDEADRMVDMGFLPSITKIVDRIDGEHQTLLFSATIDKNVKRVSKSMMNDPVTVEIARRGDTSDNVEQFIIHINHQAKPETLNAILADRGAERVIVFARTKHRVDTCARMLKREGYKAETIHSDRSQAQRRKALAAFDKGDANILVATDVLARGIDVSNVDYVVNYDLPMMAEDYIHRIGRTGRAGEKGFAVSLVSPENKGLLKDIERLIKQKLPELEIEGFDRNEIEQHAKERVAAGAKDNDFDHKKSTAKAASAGKPKRDKRHHDDERDDSHKHKSERKGDKKRRDFDGKKKDFKSDKPEKKQHDMRWDDTKKGKKNNGESEVFGKFYGGSKKKSHDSGDAWIDEDKPRRPKKKTSGKGDFAEKRGHKGFDRKGPKRDFDKGPKREGGFKKGNDRFDRGEGKRDDKRSFGNGKGGYGKLRGGKGGQGYKGGKGDGFKGRGNGGSKGGFGGDKRGRGPKKSGSFRPGRYSSNH